MEEANEARRLTVSVIQMCVLFGETQKNIENARCLMEKAMAAKPDLLLLPEFWATGFFPSPIEDYLAQMGEARAMLSTFARDHGVYVAGGTIPTEEADGIYNRLTLWNRTGEEIAHYDKTHLFTPGGEAYIFQKGRHLSDVVSIDGIPAAFAVCYDIRFPELVRSAAERGAELLLFPTNWPERRARHFRILSEARAIENQIFIAACNASGELPGGYPLAGSSALYDPWGNALEKAEQDEAILMHTLDFADIQKARKRISAWEDRRPDLYGD